MTGRRTAPKAGQATVRAGLCRDAYAASLPDALPNPWYGMFPPGRRFTGTPKDVPGRGPRSGGVDRWP